MRQRLDQPTFRPPSGVTPAPREVETRRRIIFPALHRDTADPKELKTPQQFSQNEKDSIEVPITPVHQKNAERTEVKSARSKQNGNKDSSHVTLKTPPPRIWGATTNQPKTFYQPLNFPRVLQASPSFQQRTHTKPKPLPSILRRSRSLKVHASAGDRLVNQKAAKLPSILSEPGEEEACGPLTNQLNSFSPNRSEPYPAKGLVEMPQTLRLL